MVKMLNVVVVAMLNIKRFFWFHFWYHRYWYWSLIKDFFTLKANKAHWHHVISVYEKYPDGFMSDLSRTTLYYDGEKIDEIEYPNGNNFSFSIWFNPQKGLPFLGKPDTT